MKTYEAMPGEDINTTAKNMVAMADRFQQPVTAEFNDIPLDAAPGSNPKDIVAGYHEETTRRHEAYVASPEYKQRQQEAEEAHRLKLEQQAAALAIAPATLTLRDPAGWAKAVEVNKADPYSNAVIVYAEKWARIMEARMKQVDGMTVAECAEAASHLADDDGLTGFMYGAAVSTLSKVWIHGDELRAWHNRQYLPEDKAKAADESGGVVNPAILTIAA